MGTSPVTNEKIPDFIVREDLGKKGVFSGLLGRVKAIYSYFTKNYSERVSWLTLNQDKLPSESYSARTQILDQHKRFWNTDPRSKVRVVEHLRPFKREMTIIDKRFVTVAGRSLPGTVLPDITKSSGEINAIEMALYEPKETGFEPNFLERIRRSFSYYIRPLFNWQDSRVKINYGKSNESHCVNTKTLDKFIENSKKPHSGYKVTIVKPSGLFGFEQEITVEAVEEYYDCKEDPQFFDCLDQLPTKNNVNEELNSEDTPDITDEDTSSTNSVGGSKMDESENENEIVSNTDENMDSESVDGYETRLLERAFGKIDPNLLVQ